MRYFVAPPVVGDTPGLTFALKSPLSATIAFKEIHLKLSNKLLSLWCMPAHLAFLQTKGYRLQQYSIVFNISYPTQSSGKSPVLVCTISLF